MIMENQERSGYKQGKSPLIKGLMPGLTERGKIKIGMKGDSRGSGGGGTYQLPKKLDYFIITTLQRGTDNNFMKDNDIYGAIGLEPMPRRIPITLLFDDIALNFQSRYSCYFGKTLFCSGDGEFAHQMKSQQNPERALVSCPCHRNEPTFKGDDSKGNGRCKINGTLSCMITGANVIGGVWKFRTTGYNSTVGILSSLTLIKTMTGGMLAGIPLYMTIQPKVATNPIDGTAVTVYVVGVEYAGTMDDLQKGALQLAEKNASFRQRLTHVENEVRQLISADAELVDQAGDIREEFHPQEASLVQPASETTATTPAAAAVTAETVVTAAATTPAAVVPTETRRRGRGPAKPAEPPPPAATETATPAADPLPEPPAAQLMQPDDAVGFDMFE